MRITYRKEYKKSGLNPGDKVRIFKNRLLPNEWYWPSTLNQFEGHEKIITRITSYGVELRELPYRLPFFSLVKIED